MAEPIDFFQQFMQLVEGRNAHAIIMLQFSPGRNNDRPIPYADIRRFFENYANATMSRYPEEELAPQPRAKGTLYRVTFNDPDMDRREFFGGLVMSFRGRFVNPGGPIADNAIVLFKMFGVSEMIDYQEIN